MVKTGFLIAGFLALSGQLATCQDPKQSVGSLAPSPSVVLPESNVEYYLKRTFGPSAYVGAGLSAGLAQWKDYPEEWGQGGDGFGKRLAAAYGRKIVKNSIDVGVSSLHGEIMPYARCRCSGFWTRTGHAVKSTFVRPARGGGSTFAFGHVAGAYAGGFVSNVWYPPAHSSAGDGLRRGTVYLGFDTGKNILHEFWPDIKRKLFAR